MSVFASVQCSFDFFITMLKVAVSAICSKKRYILFMLRFTDV